MAKYDLISKTALLRHLDMAIECEDCPRNIDRKTYYERCACSEVADICNTITYFATFADVQPVEHSRWIPMNDGTYNAYCENCGHERGSKAWNKADYKYCPNCGARMEQED